MFSAEVRSLLKKPVVRVTGENKVVGGVNYQKNKHPASRDVWG